MFFFFFFIIDTSVFHVSTKARCDIDVYSHITHSYIFFLHYNLSRSFFSRVYARTISERGLATPNRFELIEVNSATPRRKTYLPFGSRSFFYFSRLSLLSYIRARYFAVRQSIPGFREGARVRRRADPTAFNEYGCVVTAAPFLRVRANDDSERSLRRDLHGAELRNRCASTHVRNAVALTPA